MFHLLIFQGEISESVTKFYKEFIRNGRLFFVCAEKMTKKVKKELKTSLVKIRIMMKTNGENGLKVEGENKLKQKKYQLFCGEIEEISGKIVKQYKKY